jgi:hypothetical protein
VETVQLAPAVQGELAKQYRNALSRFYGYLTAVEQIVVEDFPAQNTPAGEITRYHVDALKDLTARLSALVEGYQAR